MSEDRKIWATKTFGGHTDFVIDMVKSSELGSFFNKYGHDLDDMERRTRLSRGITPEDILELGPDEALDISAPDSYHYDKFKGAAAAIMLTAYAHNRGLIDLNTSQAIIYNEGPASNHAHLLDATQNLIFGRNAEISQEDKKMLLEVCSAFVEACKKAAFHEQSILCKPITEATKIGLSRDS